MSAVNIVNQMWIAFVFFADKKIKPLPIQQEEAL